MLTPAPNPLTPTPNPLLRPREAVPVVGGITLAEQEMKGRPHLGGDHRLKRDHKAEVREARQAKSAADAIGELPGPGEAVHLIVAGRFALWDVVPAVLDTDGGPIEQLHVATLGFSKRNIEGMAAMLDAGAVRSLRLLCSHYFKGTSPEIYGYAADALRTRPGAAFLSLRTHCKLLLIRTPTRTLTVESSANLRSCKNIEQVTLIGSPDVYTFHAGWIDDLFTRGADHVNCYTGGTIAARPGQAEPSPQVGAVGGNGTGRARGGRRNLPR